LGDGLPSVGIVGGNKGEVDREVNIRELAYVNTVSIKVKKLHSVIAIVIATRCHSRLLPLQIYDKKQTSNATFIPTANS